MAASRNTLRSALTVAECTIEQIARQLATCDPQTSPRRHARLVDDLARQRDNKTTAKRQLELMDATSPEGEPQC